MSVSLCASPACQLLCSVFLLLFSMLCVIIPPLPCSPAHSAFSIQHIRSHFPVNLFSPRAPKKCQNLKINSVLFIYIIRSTHGIVRLPTSCIVVEARRIASRQISSDKSSLAALHRNCFVPRSGLKKDTSKRSIYHWEVPCCESNRDSLP
jgi:hypothetical protein